MLYWLVHFSEDTLSARLKCDLMIRVFFYKLSYTECCVQSIHNQLPVTSFMNDIDITVVCYKYTDLLSLHPLRLYDYIRLYGV